MIAKSLLDRRRARSLLLSRNAFCRLQRATAYRASRGIYLTKLLGNDKASRYIRRSQPEVLDQFAAIIEATALE